MEKETINKKTYNGFTYLANGLVNYFECSTIKSTDKLTPGAYKIKFLEYPDCKVQVVQDTDFELVKTVNFSDKEKMDNVFKAFFDETVKAKIIELGFHHKIGVLLYGDAGTGKTSIMKYYINEMIEKHGAVCFYINERRSFLFKCWEFIQTIRAGQNNPFIIVFDEFDGQCNDNWAYIKTMIDGNEAIDNCVFLASTNHFDKIPTEMTNRPSRFKYCLKIEGVQCKNEIVSIITPMISDICSEKEINEIAEQLKGSTLDSIKQHCLDKIMDLKHYDIKNKKSIGFKVN